MITIYLCSNCEREYRDKRMCKRHEKSCKKFHCEDCANAYNVYGCELECKRHDQGKKCKHQKKDAEQ